MRRKDYRASMFAGYAGPIIDPTQARKLKRARRLIRNIEQGK